MTTLLPIYRGTAEGARCDDCPFSTAGDPTRPVYSEHPEDPQWIIVGEGPGRTEVFLKRPFVGPTGQVVNQILAKIGRPRGDLAILNATLCLPTLNSNEADRHRAAECCKPRLQQELAQWPGKPILTLGAVAAKSIIPKATLDQIDPPDTPREIKKQQKLKQQPTRKRELLKQKRITKIAERRLKRMIKVFAKPRIAAYKKTRKAKPDQRWLDNELAPYRVALTLKAQRDAVLEYDVKLKEAKLKKQAKDAQGVKPRKPRKVKISDIVSTMFMVDVDGSGPRAVIPAIHPAALLRGGGASIGGSHTPDLAFINIIYDAAKIDAISKGKDIRLNFPIEVEFESSDHAVRLFLQIVHEALAEGEIALDLETYVDDPDRHSALMMYVAKIRAIGLATSKRAISVMWDLLPGWCHSYLQLLFNRVILTTHNGIYDRTVLRAHGFIIDEGLFEDTLLGHHSSFPGNAHRLQVVTAQFFGVECWKSEFRNTEETPEKLTTYCAKDVFSTRSLRTPLALHIKRTKTEEVYALDKKMAEIAGRMHLVGMPVDREINSQLLTTFSKNVAESRRHVEDIARDPKLREQIFHHLALQQASVQRKLDPEDFEQRYQVRLAMIKHDPDWRWKISASKHIAALLQAIGVPLIQTTAGGQISTKKDILETLVDVPVVREIITFRENDKLCSTFIWQIFDREVGGEIIQHGYADAEDRIHPIWSVHKITGRWASRWPVVSNVPKDKWRKLVADALAAIMGLVPKGLDKSGKFSTNDQIFRVNKDKTISKMMRPNLRAQIKAPKGKVFVGGDFAQLEYRIIALLSGDAHLCRVFAEGGDIHRENARVIWPSFDKLDPDTQKEIRERAKPMGYGAMYLAQVETLHQQMLKEGYIVKLVDVADAIAKLLKAMAGVVRWQHETILKASSPPYEIRDILLGRRRVWPMGQVEGTEAVNFGVQTCGASIMNRGLANHWESLKKYKEADMIGQFHDAVVDMVWEDDAEAVAVDMKRDFEQEYERDGRSIPFLFEPKIGTDWTQV